MTPASEPHPVSEDGTNTLVSALLIASRAWGIGMLRHRPSAELQWQQGPSGERKWMARKAPL